MRLPVDKVGGCFCAVGCVFVRVCDGGVLAACVRACVLRRRRRGQRPQCARHLTCSLNNHHITRTNTHTRTHHHRHPHKKTNPLSKKQVADGREVPARGLAVRPRRRHDAAELAALCLPAYEHWFHRGSSVVVVACFVRGRVCGRVACGGGGAAAFAHSAFLPLVPATSSSSSRIHTQNPTTQNTNKIKQC